MDYGELEARRGLATALDMARSIATSTSRDKRRRREIGWARPQRQHTEALNST